MRIHFVTPRLQKSVLIRTLYASSLSKYFLDYARRKCNAARSGFAKLEALVIITKETRNDSIIAKYKLKEQNVAAELLKV